MDSALGLSACVDPAANKSAFHFTTTNLLKLTRVLRDPVISALSCPNVGINTQAAKSCTVEIAIRARMTVEGTVSMKNPCFFDRNHVLFHAGNDRASRFTRETHCKKPASSFWGAPISRFSNPLMLAITPKPGMSNAFMQNRRTMSIAKVRRNGTLPAQTQAATKRSPTRRRRFGIYVKTSRPMATFASFAHPWSIVNPSRTECLRCTSRTSRPISTIR